MARGIVVSGSRTSSPRVAIRAYPAKAKKSRPADCRIPYADADPNDSNGECQVWLPTPTTTSVTPSKPMVRTTRTVANRAVRVIPRRLTTVSPTTAAIARNRVAGASPPTA